MGNSIVAGLSAKSGNGQLSAKEQAALDQKMAAMDKKIQAKLNGQSGATDPVIQMQSQNGVLVPQGSNPVEIFDWYQENGLLETMDDQQYHKLALGANAYEDKSLARIQASMDYSQMLRQDLMRKQYSVDASAYRLAQSAHEMKYYALGGGDQGGSDRRFIPITPAPTPTTVRSPEKPFDWSNAAGKASTIIGAAGNSLDMAATLKAKDAANAILNRGGNLNAYQRGLLDDAAKLSQTEAIFSTTSKSGQAISVVSASGLGKLARGVPLAGNLLGLATIPIDAYSAPKGQGWDAGIAATVSFGGGFVAATAGFKGGALLGAAAALFVGPLAIPVLAAVGAIAFAGVYEFGDYGTEVKQWTLKQLK